jgi:hypothetical protein
MHDSHERPRELLVPCFLKELIPADPDSQCLHAGQIYRKSGDHFEPIAMQDFISYLIEIWRQAFAATMKNGLFNINDFFLNNTVLRSLWAVNFTAFKLCF